MSYPWLVEGQTRGGWTFDNILANSNHLSGTAVDLNWNKYPFRLLTMPHDKVRKVRGHQDLTPARH